MRIEFADEDFGDLVERIVGAVEARLRESNGHAGEQRLFPEKVVAEMLGISVYFLKEARQQGHIVSHSKTRPVLYTKENIEAVRDWLASR